MFIMIGRYCPTKVLLFVSEQFLKSETYEDNNADTTALYHCTLTMYSSTAHQHGTLSLHLTKIFINRKLSKREKNAFLLSKLVKINEIFAFYAKFVISSFI